MNCVAQVAVNPSNCHAYRIVRGTISWDAANAAASSQELNGVVGHLATITDADEQGFLETEFADLIQGCHLGARQLPGSPEPAGGWYWITGEPWEYTHWLCGEPSNGSGCCNEDVLQFGRISGACFGGWNDTRAFVARNGIEAGYVVEFDLDRPPITSHPASQSICLHGHAELTIAAAGNVSPEFKWQIEVASNTWMNVADGTIACNGGTLTAANTLTNRLQIDFDLPYGAPPIRMRCIVTNACGSATSEPATLVPCQSDLTCDNLVDDADFVVFAAAYNVLDCADPAMAAGCPADLNGDGLVDDSDFVEFVAAYNNLGCL
ncbi:MAG: hypothetical protein U0570_04850 [Phycisphaerales bacterium]